MAGEQVDPKGREVTPFLRRAVTDKLKGEEAGLIAGGPLLLLREERRARAVIGHDAPPTQVV